MGCFFAHSLPPSADSAKINIISTNSKQDVLKQPACTETRNAGMPERRNAGIPERRNAGTPERRNTKTRNTKLLKPGTQNY